EKDKVERLSYSVNETAEAIGVSSRTVWDYIRDGSIKHFRMGTRVLVPKAELERFIQERMQEGGTRGNE
ncbi:MAG: helix-turn-helix domain-containing protein, partial [Planctomycetaceae bacterium]|nr:helix-turn-helix domain-containing protein [Planctomycetaceae bacterium]